MIIGIDPGKNGGIAIMNNNKLFLRKMPETPKELHETLKFLNKVSKGNVTVFMEKVQGLPGMGGSSMFNFGKGFGWLEMALISLEMPVETITPQKWQKEFQLGTKGKLSSTQWKNKLKAKAEQLFPSKKIFLWGADAVLIAEYGRRNLK